MKKLLENIGEKFLAVFVVLFILPAIIEWMKKR